MSEENNETKKLSPWKSLWHVMPLWLKAGIGIAMAVKGYEAWHIREVQAQLEPFKTTQTLRNELILKRQDDLQRSFNYLEERQDKNHSILLEAVLRK